MLKKIKTKIFIGKWLPGGYDKEEKAARAYDLAALKYWGPTTHINFPVSLLGLSSMDTIQVFISCN